ncbi:hypothetical protein J2X54_003546 [Duganella sp. 3397]|uniref:PEP-CTERM motif protein n=1 Tax=Duganella phyllosphaerae TaxID=762836 RepID=A0A1E7W8W1_9BURK|nr:MULTISPECIES: FxDxF family PEP-CTERM protein [Duganella]MDR7051059.1 hypothetical protein [Duganella sp. 3397]OEZ92680.1 PEP-CTERM motif protein [Duganella phyllosphaerae]
MKLKNILIASMIMGASAMTSSAFAANIGDTEQAVLVSNNAGGFQTVVGNTFTAGQTSDVFNDRFTFTLNGNYNAAGTLSSTFLSTNPIQDLVINGFSLVKYDPVTQAVISTYAGTNVLGSGAGTEDYWKFSANGLSAGSYYLSVNGLVQGAGGGSYSSNVNLAMAPVPEAETYAMMIAGLGLLGVVARRRKAAKQA